MATTSSSSTQLALYDAQGILKTLMETRDRTKCCICDKTLGSKTYLVCRFPDAPANTRGIPKEHEGHTACEECASDRCKYVGDGGSCVACFHRLGGRRAAVAKAGVALIPPVLNSMANTMLAGFEQAEKHMREAQDAAEKERLQEQVDRRVAAQDEAARKRGFADRAAELAYREKTMDEARPRGFEGDDWDDYVAWKMAEDARAAREAEAQAKAAAEAEAAAKAEAEKQEQAAKAAVEELRRAPERQQEEEGEEAAAAGAGSSRRIRRGPPRALTAEEREARLAKSRRTREENKAKKRKLEEYDSMSAQVDVLRRKLDAFWVLAMDRVAELGGNTADFQYHVQQRFEEAEAADTEEEEENGEEDDSDGEEVD